MPLTTDNAGAVVAGKGPSVAPTTVVVEMLKGTFVHSIGRDVKAEEVVEISAKDAAFLLPYGFAKRVEVAADETDESADVETDETETTDNAPKGNRRSNKKKDDQVS